MAASFSERAYAFVFFFVRRAHRQIRPFQRYHDLSLFLEVYVTQYYLCCLPIGHKLTYRT